MDMFMCVIITTLGIAVETAYVCSGNSSLYASPEPQIITSPGFPEHYPNSMECYVTVSATEDHVLHVEVVHMQLSIWNNTCEKTSYEGDFLVAYDGHNDTHPILHKWCGSDYAPMSTSGGSLCLMFSTDEHVADLGFVLRFWSQKAVNTSCEHNKHPYHVGDKPVYLAFPGSNEDIGKKCVYHIKADDTSVSITLSIKSWNMSMETFEGMLKIYDGPNNSSPPLLSWRHDEQPFSHLTSSGRSITVVPPVSINGAINTFIIKATGNNNRDSSCSQFNETVEEITSLPSYISLNINRLPCPLKIISRDFGKTLRLDLIGRRFNLSDIEDFVNITEGSMDGSAILASVDNHCITYRSRGPVVYISPTPSLKDGTTMLLRVQALESLLNGEVTYKQAVNSSVISDIEMENLPNNAYIVYKISADSVDNIVTLEMRGNCCKSKDCGNDVIEFFDGYPNEDELIKRWYPRRGNKITVTSAKSYLSFVVKTDEVSSLGYYKGSYFSLGNSSTCGPELVDLKASAEMMQFVMSPNYPRTYSLNSMCTWRIAAPRINYVVLATVLMSDLPDDCSDLVYVIYGVYPTDKTVARICGTDKPTFRSDGPILILKFTSDSKTNHYGFKMSYTTEHKTGGQRKMPGPPVGEIAGACIALFVVGGIIYVCVHESRKRRKELKRKREDY